MSYLAQYLSKEDFNEVEQATPEEAKALSEELDSRINEIESLDSQRERAERVVDELETQQEAVRAIVEQNGGLTENEAALIESQRRTAAVALDLNPDDPAAQAVVDQPGLESMVNHGVLSLEANEKFTDKIKNTIARIVKAIREKIKSFFVWIGKFSNVLKLDTKEAYDFLKGISDEEFKKRVSWLPEEVLKGRGVLFENGVFDYAKARLDLLDWRMEVMSPFKTTAKSIYALFKAMYKVNKEKKSVDKEKADEVVSKAYKDLSLQLKKIKMEDHKRTSFQMLGRTVVTHDLYRDDAKGIDLFRYSIIEVEKTDIKRDQIKRKDLLKAVNQDFRVIALGDGEEAILQVLEDMGTPVEGLRDMLKGDEYKREMSALNLMFYSFTKVMFSLSATAIQRYRDLITLIKQIRDVKEPKETLKLGYKG